MLFEIFILFTSSILSSLIFRDIYINIYGKYKSMEATIDSLETDILTLNTNIESLVASVKTLISATNKTPDMDTLQLGLLSQSQDIDAKFNKTLSMSEVLLMRQEEFQTQMLLELTNIKLILDGFHNSSEAHSTRCHNGSSFGYRSSTSSDSPIVSGTSDSNNTSDINMNGHHVVSDSE